MKTIKKYLFDIKTSINSIEEYVNHVDTFEMYQENKGSMWIGVGTVERFIISVTFNNLYCP